MRAGVLAIPVAAALCAALASWLGAGPLAIALAAFIGGGGAALMAGGSPAGRPPPLAEPPPDGSGVAGGRDLLWDLPLALVLLDRQANVCFANPAAESLVGPILPGAPLATVLRARALTEAVSAVDADGSGADVAFTHMQAREQRELLAHLRRVEAKPPFNATVMIVIEDRTGQIRADRMRRDFIANASHELKTPLASIAGFIETLQGPARGDPQAAARFLPIMARQAQRMKRLIEDLMSLNRIEMSAHQRPADRIPLAPLLREAVAAMAPVAESAGVRIEVETPGEGIAVTGDRDQVSQLFINLIDNGIKYGASGGVVRIHPAPDEPGRSRMAGVSVTDEGPGIARDQIPRLTERFYRVNDPGLKGADGTGLGLSIVKHILNRHRGDLSIRSVPGVGATFTVWLPRAGDSAGSDRP